MGIESNVQEVKGRIARACERVGRSPDEVTLVAISKTQHASAIRAAFNGGIRHFGENRVQECQIKLNSLGDLRDQTIWHMVGHLQTNKAKTAMELFDIIQSVDSMRLAGFLNRHTQRVLPIFVEVNIAGEVTKGGFPVDEVPQAVTEMRQMPNLEIRGLMTVAPWLNEAEKVRPVFRRLRELCSALDLEHLSMGMTDDFEVAVEEGATLVRVGRAIFGERRV